MRPPKKRSEKALALLVHATAATRPQTAEATVACNIRLTNARDFVMHTQAHDIASGGIGISAAEFEANREAALAALRAQCGACGLCAVFGLIPP